MAKLVGKGSARTAPSSRLKSAWTSGHSVTAPAHVLGIRSCQCHRRIDLRVYAHCSQPPVFGFHVERRWHLNPPKGKSDPTVRLANVETASRDLDTIARIIIPPPDPVVHLCLAARCSTIALLCVYGSTKSHPRATSVSRCLRISRPSEGSHSIRTLGNII